MENKSNCKPSVNILGVHVSAINMHMAISTIAGWIREKQCHYICVTPAHGIMECQHQPELRKIFNNSGMTTPDGMSVVWLMHLAGQLQVERVYGPDLMLATCEYGQEMNWKHFFYGGAPGIADQLTVKLHERFPKLQIAGTYCPPFRVLTRKEDEQVINQINQSQTDIVWVGISTPKQERWMAEHVGKLQAPVLIGVGAAFDFLSGNKKQAPKWIQRSGLEWLYRFSQEPGRLWRRYIQYPHFVLLVIGQALKLKRYP